MVDRRKRHVEQAVIKVILLGREMKCFSVHSVQ